VGSGTALWARCGQGSHYQLPQQPTSQPANQPTHPCAQEHEEEHEEGDEPYTPAEVRVCVCACVRRVCVGLC
jgi:hypothetical protein